MAGPEYLGDVLSEWQTLKFVCNDCGHKKAWSRRRAIAVFGARVTRHDIRVSMICTKCGSKNCDVGK